MRQQPASAPYSPPPLPPERQWFRTAATPTRLTPAFVHCLDTIRAHRLPALCGLRIVIQRGPACAPVGGRHDLLVERAGLHRPGSH